jgi:DNA-binding SARP family transcriptional activator
VLSPLEDAPALLQTSRDTVYLDTESGIWVDARVFHTLVKEAARHEAAGRRDSAREVLQQADALYRGELLPEESEAEWTFEERRRFADMHAAVLLALARHAYRAEDWRQVEILAARALRVDPCLESACRLQMSALARQGRRTEALRVFEFCRRALQMELDVAPSSRTLALVQQIRAMT